MLLLEEAGQKCYIGSFMTQLPGKTIFVINPIAGGIDKEAVIERCQSFAEEHGFDSTLYMTTGQDDSAGLKRLIDKVEPTTVVAVGGDGTVNLAGALLIGTNINLGIVPLGSGNGMSKDLGIPQNVEEALDVLTEGVVLNMDTLVINGIPSLHLSDLGFNALVVEKFAEGERRGPGAYAWHVMREYINYEPKRYEIITPNELYTGKAFMVTIANARTFGSNAIINPEGVLDDGFFEICILEDFPKSAGIAILYQMMSAEIHTSLHVHIIKCNKAIIKNLEGSPIQIDGEVVPVTDELEVNILPQSLRVITTTQA